MDRVIARALLWPHEIERNLAQQREAGCLLPHEVPNLWQIQLGVLRMWHRVFFRSQTIGTCRSDSTRRTWRARMLAKRPLRFPFLLAERAVHPLDFSGLASSPERIVRHLLGAHHDGLQFLYDFELLASRPEVLHALLAEAEQVVQGTHPRAEWLRDLVVFEHYHERLVEALRAFLSGELVAEPALERDPDTTFRAYARWCASQPKSPAETLSLWRVGRYSISAGAT